MALRYNIEPKTEIGKKVQKLAESLPYKEWYLPDPYDPTSMIQPIGGISKNNLFKQLTKFISESDAKKIAGQIPRGARKNVWKEIFHNWDEIFGKRRKISPHEEGVWSGPTIRSSTGERSASHIGLRKPASPETIFEEFGHELYSNIPASESARIERGLKKIAPPHYFKGDPNFILNPSQIFAEGYSLYKTRNPEFEYFPIIIKHYIKKYDKMMR